jgi:hypothetical protein
MKQNLQRIIDAGRGKTVKKSPLYFDNLIRQIDRAIATDREKKIAKLELCRVMGASN